MNDENRDLLEEVLKETLGACIEAEPGSEEHTTMVDEIVKLGNVIKEDSKNQLEIAKNYEESCDKKKQRELDKELKQLEAEADWKKFVIQTGTMIGLAAAGGLFKHVWRNKTLKFEETGTISSFIGRMIFREK